MMTGNILFTPSAALTKWYGILTKIITFCCHPLFLWL